MLPRVPTEVPVFLAAELDGVALSSRFSPDSDDVPELSICLVQQPAEQLHESVGALVLVGGHDGYQ